MSTPRIVTIAFRRRKFAVRYVAQSDEDTVMPLIEEACRVLKISYDIDIPPTKVILRTMGVDLCDTFLIKNLDLNKQLTLAWPALENMDYETYYVAPPVLPPSPMFQRPAPPMPSSPTSSSEVPEPPKIEPPKVVEKRTDVFKTQEGKIKFNPKNIPREVKKMSWSTDNAKPFFWMIKQVFRESDYVEDTPDNYLIIHKVDLIKEFERLFNHRPWTNSEIDQFEIDPVTKSRFPPSYINLEAAAKEERLLETERQDVILLVEV